MFEKIKNYLSPNNWKNDTLSGLTVALALVPEAIAFAFVAGVDPIVGLYAAFMVSLIAALLSGRPGMISGATGALAVVMVSLVAQYGVEYLFATVVLMGLIQITFGVFKLGKFARIIPHPVMLGFVNGLAIVIGLAQFTQFKDSSGAWLSFDVLFPMSAFILLTMAIMHFLPKFTKAIPSALAAIVVVTLAVIIFGIDIPTVKDMLSGGSMAAGFPSFSIPEIPFTLEALWVIIPYAVILAFIGLIESLMTLSLIDEITNTRGQSNKECLAQGTANIVTGFFGGMGGCAMVGQSMINIDSNGRGRWGGIVAGLGLLAFILFGSNLIEQIPLAALVGVMFMVVIGTFAWSSLRILNKIPKSDAFVLAFVSIITVFTDLAIAVISGIVISALVFSWKKSTNIEIQDSININDKKTIHHKVSGYIFFASSKNFSELFSEKIISDPVNVYIDFQNAKILDHSGIEAINSLTKKYKEVNKKLHLQHLSLDCRKLLLNAEDIIEINIEEDPKYKVADNLLG
ncbi:TPA: SulP family inorganic anion transporter [Candidatus Gracilibacteria bacterium]|nr:SulP family inorganic anion transporter [Candidatus Peregrinibacteria bacterium]HIQ56477.1 SulP family inorganic anion transporter [Candidatus Gracilibacteria bacterium]HIQ57408.1 SulP family inorganic anion transporter [Candidatus Gracilibacteria bacterium]